MSRPVAGYVPETAAGITTRGPPPAKPSAAPSVPRSGVSAESSQDPAVDVGGVQERDIEIGVEQDGVRV